MARRPIGRVLVISRGPVGDFALSLAALRHIRAAHADARITLLTTLPFETLARSCPYIDLVDLGGAPETFGEWADLVGRVRASRFDRVYDLEASPFTARLFKLLWPLPPKWSGVALGCALPHRDPRRASMHLLERHAGQLAAAGVWPDAPTRPGEAPPADAAWITRRFRDTRLSPRPQVLLLPGGDTAQPRWPVSGFGELALTLRGQGYDVLVLGGPEDAAAAHAIQHRAPVRDLTGQADYAEIALLGARAALAVGADSGLMTLVAAAGAPTLILADQAQDLERLRPRGHIAILCAEDLADLPVSEVLRAAQRLVPPVQKTS
jgi:ADP-heptose:LPS heptosyltransferase